LVALAAFPTLSDRISLGFGVVDPSGSEVEDWDTISASRIGLWSLAVEEIAGAPVAGQGRMTIVRSAVYTRGAAEGEGSPGHPHDAYLEMLLDSGALGLAVTLLLFVGFPVLAYMRRQPEDPLLATVLYAGLAGAAAILIMGSTGQTFWPREGVDTILYLYALMLAGSVTRPLPATAEAAGYAHSTLDTKFPPPREARHPQVLRR
jgi:O-antigen ligase